MAVESVIVQGRVFLVVCSEIKNNSSDPAVSSLVANVQSVSGSVNVRHERIPALPAKPPGLVESLIAKFEAIRNTLATQGELSHQPGSVTSGLVKSAVEKIQENKNTPAPQEHLSHQSGSVTSGLVGSIIAKFEAIESTLATQGELSHQPDLNPLPQAGNNVPEFPTGQNAPQIRNREIIPDNIRVEYHLFTDRSTKLLMEAENCKNPKDTDIESKKKEIFDNLVKFKQLIYSYRDDERACTQQYRLKSLEMTAEKLAHNLITEMDRMKIIILHREKMSAIAAPQAESIPAPQGELSLQPCLNPLPQAGNTVTEFPTSQDAPQIRNGEMIFDHINKEYDLFVAESGEILTELKMRIEKDKNDFQITAESLEGSVVKNNLMKNLNDKDSAEIELKKKEIFDKSDKFRQLIHSYRDDERVRAQQDQLQNFESSAEELLHNLITEMDRMKIIPQEYLSPQPDLNPLPQAGNTVTEFPTSQDAPQISNREMSFDDINKEYDLFVAESGEILTELKMRIEKDKNDFQITAESLEGSVVKNNLMKNLNDKDSAEIELKKKEIFDKSDKFRQLIHSYRDDERARAQQEQLKSLESSAEELLHNLITEMDRMKNKL